MNLRPCENCGQDFKVQTNEVFCLPCELAIRAMEPPQHLKDMRWVYEGNQPRTAGETQMTVLLEQDVGRFVDRLTRFDDQYRSALAKRMPEKKVVEVPVWDGKGPCPTCQRGPAMADASVSRCLADAEAWLRARCAAGTAESSST